MEVAVLGRSLRYVKSVYSMVLLHTKEVPPAWLSILRQIDWLTNTDKCKTRVLETDAAKPWTRSEAHHQ